jgi:vanillate O-demethylase monooxygenase subunit
VNAALDDRRPRNCTFSREDWKVLAACWHPVAYSSEVVAGKITPATLLDCRLIAYRTSEGVRVAADLCIHRGAALSRGWMEGDELVCGYHGFRYRPDGSCTRVPAQPRHAVPSRICLATHPAIERYGLVWVLLAGTDASLPLPVWPELEDGGLRKVQLPRQLWRTSAPRQVENFNDVAHLSWLHADTFGNRDQPEVDPYEVRESPGGLHFRVPYEGKYLGDTGAAQRREPERIMYAFDLTLPFATRLAIEFEGPRRYYMFDLASPVSLTETAVFFQVALNYNADLPDEKIIESQARVLSEDQPMVESQHPEELPLDLTEEFHIRADRLSTHYRKALVKLGLGREFSA